MDFLLEEIQRKEKQLKQNEVTSEKKYFKRGELAEKQREDYMKKQEERLQAKHKHEDDQDAEEEKQASKKRKEGESSTTQNVSIDRDEVIRRLRERGEPIRLFGESDDEAGQRLRRIEMLQPEINKGYRNDLKDAMDRIDEEYLKEQGEKPRPTDADLEDLGTTLDDIKVIATNMGKGNQNLDQEVILKFLKFLLGLWAKEVNSGPEDKKRSIEGKLASATQKQTHEYLKPLFRKLKSKNAPKDILGSLTEIVSSLLERDYVKANDSYLQMAIGNAPWPIGVTMVGIHARTGREKIFAQHVAHVLNDETQRKYIQALKRLMTFCQRKFVTDPSKSVEYKAIAS